MMTTVNNTIFYTSDLLESRSCVFSPHTQEKVSVCGDDVFINSIVVILHYAYIYKIIIIPFKYLQFYLSIKKKEEKQWL